jgi:sugar phosphate isomerase/epimerase
MADSQVDRRRFLAAGAAVGVAWAAGPTRAIEPIARTGKPQFKFSLAAYSYRDLLQGKKKSLTLDDFVVACAEMGLEGTELTSYYFPDPVTPEYLRTLKRRCFELGLDVSGTAVGNDFCVPPGPKRDEQMALVKRWVDYAEILGAPVIRIFSGNQKPGQSAEEAHRLAVQGMEEACDYAGQHGICLALENHGGLTETAEGALALVRDVKSPWFGFNLDTGNFHGSDVYADLEKLAPYAVNVQIKVVVSPAGGKREPSDFGRLAQMLKQCGYRGYIVLEYEEDEDPRVACPRFVDQLREAFRV